MTTIVADLRTNQMAADSRVTSGNAFYESQKLFESPDGALIGVAGSMNDALLFVEWYQAGADRTQRPVWESDEFEALVLNEAGLARWNKDCMRLPVKGRQFYAIGSGGYAAMGAIYAGADLVEAIKIAAKCDLGTGGQVVIKELASHPRAKARRAEK